MSPNRTTGNDLAKLMRSQVYESPTQKHELQAHLHAAIHMKIQTWECSCGAGGYVEYLKWNFKKISRVIAMQHAVLDKQMGHSKPCPILKAWLLRSKPPVKLAVRAPEDVSAG